MSAITDPPSAKSAASVAFAAWMNGSEELVDRMLSGMSTSDLDSLDLLLQGFTHKVSATYYSRIEGEPV